MSNELTGRERIWRALHHQEADRVGIMDTLWSSTMERWHNEGLPESPSPNEIFGYDMLEIRPDLTLQFPIITIEDTDEYIIIKDSYGTTIKNWKRATSTPGWLGHVIKTRTDWEEHKWRTEWGRNRVDWEPARKTYEEGRARGQFIYYSGAICWDATLPIIGAETMLYAMADDPEWVRDMYNTLTDLYLAGAEEMLGAGFEFDGVWVYDDMAYRSGTFFSPRIYEELIFSNDKRVCEFFKARNIPVILHTCGQVGKLIPKLIEAGYACLQPLEVKAGMDVVELKKKYGQGLAFMGGIDIRKMSDPDPKVIEEEIATKIPIAMQGGGYIYHSDHSVPDTVSLEQYRRVLELVRHYGTFRS